MPASNNYQFIQRVCPRYKEISKISGGEISTPDLVDFS